MLRRLVNHLLSGMILQVLEWPLRKRGHDEKPGGGMEYTIFRQTHLRKLHPSPPPNMPLAIKIAGKRIPLGVGEARGMLQKYFSNHFGQQIYVQGGTP